MAGPRDRAGNPGPDRVRKPRNGSGRDSGLLRRGIEDAAGLWTAAGPVIVHTEVKCPGHRGRRTLDNCPSVALTPPHGEPTGLRPLIKPDWGGSSRSSAVSCTFALRAGPRSVAAESNRENGPVMSEGRDNATGRSATNNTTTTAANAAHQRFLVMRRVPGATVAVMPVSLCHSPDKTGCPVLPARNFRTASFGRPSGPVPRTSEPPEWRTALLSGRCP